MENKNANVFVIFYQDYQNQSKSILVIAENITEASKKFDKYISEINEGVKYVLEIENKTPKYQSILI